jgi:hypothetical protein
MTRAEWRLVPALGVSALLHVLRMPVERARMFVGLITPVDWLFTENDEQPLVNSHAAPMPNRLSTAEVKPAAAIEPANAAAVTEQRSLPQPSDPTDYAATSLDV